MWWGVGLPKPLRVHILPLCAPDAEIRAVGFNVCPPGFQSLFCTIPHYFPISNLWNNNLYPMHWVTIFYRDSQIWFESLEILELDYWAILELLKFCGLFKRWTKCIFHCEVDISIQGPEVDCCILDPDIPQCPSVEGLFPMPWCY